MARRKRSIKNHYGTFSAKETEENGIWTPNFTAQI
jgi:hypothetical protein